MPERVLSVLHFTEAEARAGAEEHILRLAAGLDRKRFRTALACRPALADLLRRDLPADVPLFPVDLSGGRWVGAAIRLAGILRRERIDILHSHMFRSSLFATPVGWLSGVPVVVKTSHGREAWRKGWKAHFFVDRCVGRLVDRFIAVSQANARYLIEEKRYPAEKITVIYPACSLHRFDPKYTVPAGLRESLGIAPGAPVAVVLGRLEPQKGHRVLLAAWPQVLRDHPKAHLVCVGEGSLRAELENTVGVLGIQESVHFVGYHSDVRDWLALADFTVLPSLWEGLPGTPMESLAAGRAVVATAVDGTPEVVIDGKTGLIVPPGDPQRLAAAICLLLRDPALRDRLAEEGRAWVLEQFGLSQMVRRTEELYLSAWRCLAPAQRGRPRSEQPQTV